MARTTAIPMETLPQRFVGVIDELAGRDKTAGLAGIATGTAENIRRGRRKAVSFLQFERLREAVIRVLEREIRLLEAERQMALQVGAIAGQQRLVALETKASALHRQIQEAVK